MSRDTSKRKGWTKPQIKRLGEIKDVAAGVGLIVQGQPNRT